MGAGEILEGFSDSDGTPEEEAGKEDIWVWLKSKELGQTAGFSLWFHLPRCILVLSHSHLHCNLFFFEKIVAL